MSASRITTEEFVSLWMQAYKESMPLGELAHSLHVSAGNVSARAIRLRKVDVNLPTLPHGNRGNKSAKRYNIEKLKALVDDEDE